jgi:protein-tyrosine phosphatase
VRPGFAYVLPPVLAQGSRPPSGKRLPFDVVVLCAKEYQNASFPGSEVMRVPLDDSGPPPTQEEVQQALRVAERVKRRIQNGKTVLVTCHAGLNRSGFVSGLTLVNLGLSSSEAIRRVRDARGMFALSNSHFAELVRIHGRAQRRAA